jgi:hypothetical protein
MVVASGRTVTSALKTHGAGSMVKHGARRAAVRRLRTAVGKERNAGDRHARAAPTARRAGLVGIGADATADAVGIRGARPDAEVRRPRAAIRRPGRVEADTRVIAHTVVAMIRRTGVTIVALGVARARLPGQGRRGRRRGPAATNAGVEAGGAPCGSHLRCRGAAAKAADRIRDPLARADAPLRLDDDTACAGSQLSAARVEERPCARAGRRRRWTRLAAAHPVGATCALGGAERGRVRIRARASGRRRRAAGGDAREQVHATSQGRRIRAVISESLPTGELAIRSQGGTRERP